MGVGADSASHVVVDELVGLFLAITWMDYLAYHRSLEAVFVSSLTEITAVQIGAGCFSSATNLITAFFFWWMLNKVAHANTIPAIPENRKLPADSELIFIEVATSGFS